MEQFLVHLLGDYVLQSDYMALNKNKKGWEGALPCLIHVLIYTSCFLLLSASWKALLVIGVTHFILDHWHTPLKRFIWWRGHWNPKFIYADFNKCTTTGYYDDSPFNKVKATSGDGSTEMYYKPRLYFITQWLYIAHDNFLHLTINFFALKYLV